MTGRSKRSSSNGMGSEGDSTFMHSLPTHLQRAIEEPEGGEGGYRVEEPKGDVDERRQQEAAAQHQPRTVAGSEHSHSEPEGKRRGRGGGGRGSATAQPHTEAGPSTHTADRIGRRFKLGGGFTALKQSSY